MSMTLEQTIAKREGNWVTGLLNSQAFWVLVAIIVAAVFLSFATQAFATPQNLYNVTRNFTFTAIVALGMTFVIISGGIDLSVGSVLVFCSMVMATTMHAGGPLWLGIIVAIGTGLAVGAFNGFLIAYLGFPPFVVTLAMLSAGRSFAMIASNNQTVFQFGPDHQALLWLGGGQLIPGIANPLIYTIVLALIAGFVLRWTKFGRHVFAIGGNEHAATLTGIPVKLVKVAVYMISSLMAAICAIVQTGWLGSVTTNLGSGLELQVIAAAVIGGAVLTGGAGTAIGALAGALLIEIIRNSMGLLGINPFWQGTVIGGAILFAVAFERVRQLRARD
jgi:ribose transport system permease protein